MNWRRLTPGERHTEPKGTFRREQHRAIYKR